MRGVLVQLRKDAGLNQAALAARLRITQSEVSKYERGERALLDETADRLSALAARPRMSLAALAPPPKSVSPSTSRGRSRRRSGR